MLWKVGLKEQRERKNKSKVTQELFFFLKKEKYTRITNEKREIFKNYKREKKRVTYTNEERRKTVR